MIPWFQKLKYEDPSQISRDKILTPNRKGALAVVCGRSDTAGENIQQWKLSQMKQGENLDWKKNQQNVSERW